MWYIEFKSIEEPTISFGIYICKMPAKIKALKCKLIIATLAAIIVT